MEVVVRPCPHERKVISRRCGVRGEFLPTTNLECILLAWDEAEFRVNC